MHTVSDRIICPYCKYRLDGTEIDFAFRECIVIDCPMCGQNFTVCEQISIKYIIISNDTRKQ